MLMADRSIRSGFAVVVALTLLTETALSQGTATADPPAASAPVGTTGIGNASGLTSIPASTPTAPSRPLARQSAPAAPPPVRGFAEQDQTISRTGLATTAEDGV